MEARRWLSQPGERELIYFESWYGEGKKHSLNFGQRLVEALYNAGAKEVIVPETYEGMDGYAHADTIIVKCKPSKEGDVLIALFRFRPNEVDRVSKNNRECSFRAWWD